MNTIPHFVLHSPHEVSISRFTNNKEDVVTEMFPVNLKGAFGCQLMERSPEALGEYSQFYMFKIDWVANRYNDGIKKSISFVCSLICELYYSHDEIIHERIMTMLKLSHEWAKKEHELFSRIEDFGGFDFLPFDIDEDEVLKTSGEILQRGRS